MSLPEVLLWQRLRAGKAGAKVRRQPPIGPYIADFYCPAARLVIEIDGEAHNRADRPARDEERDRFLATNGYRILHISTADVLRDPDAVAASIAAYVAGPLHQPAAGPPPRKRGGSAPPRHGEGDRRAERDGGGASPQTAPF